MLKALCDNYTVIRSDRKTAAIHIKDGKVIFRIPKRMTAAQLNDFAEKHLEWIEKQLEKQKSELEAFKDIKPLSKSELEQLVKRALKIIPPKVEHYARLLNVSYGRITVRNQKTRWGSCSGKGNLNFNCLLALAPNEVIDSVIVHELCHRKEMNHSKRFYSLVLEVYPEYFTHHKWLKEHGSALLRLLNAE